MFTNNSTAEAASHKGTSSSKPLFLLILQLWELEMHHGLFLHVIHVAGTWMRQQGTDGLSRSWLDTGVLSGTDMLSFVPLHMSALDLQASLARWVHLWFLDLPCTWLQPFDWLTKGHQEDHFV